jgi:flagellar biosynthesis protein FlhA
VMSIAEKAVLPSFSRLLNSIHLVVPLSVMGILLVMVLPMPSIVLDLLISLNITLSIVILLVSMYILQPVHFSVFPSLLLIVTLFRLALNVASTRLILLRGSEGTSAATTWSASSSSSS